ncbi:MAG: hypothetical protein JW973_07305 [Bacteroidales bacterium]|nr:hypothetical protein [Bacteroidales bacterium]
MNFLTLLIFSLVIVGIEFLAIWINLRTRAKKSIKAVSCGKGVTKGGEKSDCGCGPWNCMAADEG